jgi:hypothetical protein
LGRGTWEWDVPKLFNRREGDRSNAKADPRSFGHEGKEGTDAGHLQWSYKSDSALCYLLCETGAENEYSVYDGGLATEKSYKRFTKAVSICKINFCFLSNTQE